MSIYFTERIIGAETITITSPINLAVKDKFLFKHDLIKELPEVNLNYLNNVNVTPQGILFNGLHIYKQFLVWPNHAREFNLGYLLRNYIKRKIKVIGPENKLLICFDYWSSGYFHWMCDVLPRLIVSEKHLKDYTLLLPDTYNGPFIEESLKIFKIKNVVKFSDKEYVKCTEALVPEHVTRSGDHNPNVMHMLRTKIVDYFQPVKTNTFPQNIFISRAKSRGRFIKNERELQTMLEQIGFTTVYYEDHSFSEQINIAFNCKNLIGLHGANLTNIMFMQPQANIMELRVRNDDKRNYYFSLASTFQVNYFYFQCEQANGNKKDSQDLNVNIAELKKEVELMLSH